MNDISVLRLNLLRVVYGFVFVGLALMIWPLILWHDDNVPHMNTAVRSLLGAVGLLSGLGLFYPLRMLPILLFEFLWKAIWIISFGLPLWLKGRLDGEYAETMFNCLVMIVLIPLIPWGYVFRTYIAAKQDPWRSPKKA